MLSLSKHGAGFFNGLLRSEALLPLELVAGRC